MRERKDLVEASKAAKRKEASGPGETRCNRRRIVQIADSVSYSLEIKEKNENESMIFDPFVLKLHGTHSVKSMCQWKGGSRGRTLMARITDHLEHCSVRGNQSVLGSSHLSCIIASTTIVSGRCFRRDADSVQPAVPAAAGERIRSNEHPRHHKQERQVPIDHRRPTTNPTKTRMAGPYGTNAASESSRC
jgi:hypothetical protein